MNHPQPRWMSRLVDALGEISPSYFSRFLPPEEGGRQSAVLMLFGPAAGGGEDVVLTERSHDLRSHAGQVSFPGGALDPGDSGPISAALREAEEEVGLDRASVEVLTTLPAIFIPVTGFVVTPVLAWWRSPHPVAPVDTGEVARAVVVPVAELAAPANRFRVTHPSGWVGVGFEAAGLFVWGFTAGLLDRMLELGGWAQPWDTERLMPLPEGLTGRPSAR